MTTAPSIFITQAQDRDFESVWKIFKQVIAKGDTYSNLETTSKEEAYQKFFGKNVKTFIAKENDQIVGLYFIQNNRIGRGSHIANCGYMVDENIRGKGIGKKLGLHSIEIAKDLNYHAMQFNCVVSTNINAINLWQSLGFKIIGTIPKGFNHKTLGLVDFHIMFKEL